MRILVVVHGYPPHESGGTELHARWLAHGLAERGHAVHVFARSDGDEGEEAFRNWQERDGSVTVSHYVHPCPANLPQGNPFHVPEVGVVFEDLVESFRPEIAHVQHLIGSTPEIVEILDRRNVSKVATLHDYWYLCPRVQGIRRDGRFCLEPEGGSACAFFCHPFSRYARLVHALSELAWNWGKNPAKLFPFRCLRRLGEMAYARGWGNTVAARGASLHRYAILRNALEGMDRLIFPSEDARKRHVAWGLDEQRCRVIEHGLPRLDRRRERKTGSPLRIAMTGVLMVHKGAHVLLDALAEIPWERWRLEIHGRRPRPSYASGIERWAKRFPPGQIRFRGGYAHDELESRLKDADLLVIPSIWPETYNIVLREAWMLGIPVIASKTGGLAEGVARGGPATLVPPDDPQALAEAIRAFLDAPIVAPPPPPQVMPPTPEENAAAIETLFLDVLKEGRGTR